MATTKSQSPVRFLWTRNTVSLFLVSALSFALASYIMIVASNYASYRSPSTKEYQILPDLGTKLYGSKLAFTKSKGFEWIPEYKNLALTDALDNIILFSSIAFIVFEDLTPLYSFVKMFSCFSITYMLRSGTVFLTSLPDPRKGCQKIDGNFFTTFVFHRCGDCIFSGHAAVATLFSLYWLYVQPKKRDAVFYMLRTKIWVTSVAELWAIIANRSHYTVDVVVAVYTSVGVFFTFAYFCDKHIARPKRLLDLTEPSRFTSFKSN